MLEAGPEHQPGADTPMAAYHSLVWECWLPAVRLAVQRWQSRQPEPLVAFLELWRALVPPWIMQHVLEQLVLVRLQAEVELWNPLTDTSPIHTWLHPWLPPLGSRLDIVYPTIRNKLSSALSSWQPTDRSAKLILLPWKDVFTRAAMAAFLTKNIVPKLEALLNLPALKKLDCKGNARLTIPPPEIAQQGGAAVPGEDGPREETDATLHICDELMKRATLVVVKTDALLDAASSFATYMRDAEIGRAHV